MTNISKKTLLIFCIALSIFLLIGCSSGENKYKTALEDTGKSIYMSLTAPQTGPIGGEWAIIGLARNNYNVEDGYYEKYIANTENYVKKLKGVLNTETGYKYTEYSRIILAFTALGEDVTSISGYNFLEKLSDMDNVCRQGTNGPIWALLAFDSGNYDIPKNKENKSQTTREGLITEILEKQLDDGGWDIADVEADPDMTAMALTSLAPYYTNSSDNIDEISGDLMDRIKAAVDKGINTLSSIQSESGTYSSMGGESAESSSQVIVALSALGVDAGADNRFIKNKNTALDGLLKFYDNDGGFYHTNGEEKPNQMATEQAYYALVSYDRYKNNKNALFQMTDN